MKITGTGPIQTAPLRRQTAAGGTQAGAFSSALSGDSAVRGPAASAEVSATASLLAIQEVDDPLTGRKRAVMRGEDILDRLDEIRVGLLLGTIPKDRLNQLVALVRRQQDRVDDPGLRDVLADIELRAQVELAKLGQLG